MTNLQKIKAVAKELGLEFKRKNATVNGARLYDFVDKETGFVVGANWTISSAISEYNYGTLHDVLS